jgi:hypothetical protein
MRKRELRKRIEHLEYEVRMLTAKVNQPVKHLGMTPNGMHLEYSPWISVPSNGALPLKTDRAVDDELLGIGN